MNTGRFKLLSLYALQSKENKTFYCADVYVEEFHVTNKIFLSQNLFNELKLNFEKYNKDISSRVSFVYNHKISAYNLIIK